MRSKYTVSHIADIQIPEDGTAVVLDFGEFNRLVLCRENDLLRCYGRFGGEPLNLGK